MVSIVFGDTETGLTGIEGEMFRISSEDGCAGDWAWFC